MLENIAKKSNDNLQCNNCLFYENGQRNNLCPLELVSKVIANEIICPKKVNKDYVESSSFTKEEAINLYTKIFGGFPAFILMGASDTLIINKVIAALKTGKEITEEFANSDY